MLVTALSVVNEHTSSNSPLRACVLVQLYLTAGFAEQDCQYLVGAVQCMMHSCIAVATAAVSASLTKDAASLQKLFLRAQPSLPVPSAAGRRPARRPRGWQPH